MNENDGLVRQRDQWIQVNEEFSKLNLIYGLPFEIINVGQAINDGTGDFLSVAIGKVRANLALINLYAETRPWYPSTGVARVQPGGFSLIKDPLSPPANDTKT